MFIDKVDNLPKIFDAGTAENVMYEQRLPTRDSRIPLSDLPKERGKYYPQSKKPVQTSVKTTLI